MSRPVGVTAIAVVFFLVSGYLAILAAIRLVSPGAVRLSLAAPWLHGLELAGPYMFLFAAAVGAAIGLGLLRLNNYARRAAILIAVLGIVMLMGKVSADSLSLSPQFFLSGAMVAARAMIVWYLGQGATAEKFRAR